jgi:hypothetical protein
LLAYLNSLQDFPRDYLFEEFINHEFIKTKLNVIGEEMSKEDETLFAYWNDMLDNELHEEGIDHPQVMAQEPNVLTSHITI